MRRILTTKRFVLFTICVLPIPGLIAVGLRWNNSLETVKRDIAHGQEPVIREITDDADDKYAMFSPVEHSHSKEENTAVEAKVQENENVGEPAKKTFEEIKKEESKEKETDPNADIEARSEAIFLAKLRNRTSITHHQSTSQNKSVTNTYSMSNGTKYTSVIHQTSTQNKSTSYNAYVAKKKEPLTWAKIKKMSMRCISLGAKMPNNESAPVTEDKWQVAEKDQVYVYSAFTDPRTENLVIHVIAMTTFGYGEELKKNNSHLYCQLWDRTSGDSNAYIYPGKVQTLCRDEETFCSAIIDCSMPFTQHNMPREGLELAIQAKLPCEIATNMLPVHFGEDTQEPDYEFVACLSGPMKKDYGNVDQFIQWVEFQKLFGAEKFAVYKHTSTAELQKYLDYYGEKKIIDNLEWNVPADMGDITDYTVIWNFGQQAMINDCLYRYMYRTKYLAYVDFDELIVPRCSGCTNWSDMMQKVKDKCDDKKHHFSVKNVFFPTQLDDEDKYATGDAKDLNILPLLKSKRQATFGAHNDRSKYIVEPRHIKRTNIHTIHTAWIGGRLDNLCIIPADKGGLHHYRPITRDIENTVQDTMLQKYDKDVIPKIKEIKEAVGEI